MDSFADAPECLLLDRRPSARMGMLLVWCAAVFAIVGLFTELDGVMQAVTLGGALLFLMASIMPIARHLRLKKRDEPGLNLDQTGLSGRVLSTPLNWSDVDGFSLEQSLSGKMSVVATLSGGVRTDMRQTIRLNTHLLALNPRDVLARLRDWHGRHGSPALS